MLSRLEMSLTHADRLISRYNSAVRVTSDTMAVDAGSGKQMKVANVVTSIRNEFATTMAGVKKDLALLKTTSTHVKSEGGG